MGVGAFGTPPKCEVAAEGLLGKGAAFRASPEGESTDPVTFTGTPWSDVLLGSESRRCCP